MKQSKIDEYVKKYNLSYYINTEVIDIEGTASGLMDKILEFKFKHDCDDFDIEIDNSYSNGYEYAEIEFKVHRPRTKKEIEDIVKELVERDIHIDADKKKQESQKEINEKKLYLKLKKKYQGSIK